MHNCAIICEYNPFHTGHLYQIERVREHGASNVFCVMSGNFIQSAMPAFCDKAIRAECAVRGGADAVIELPAVYATASAGHFAFGGIRIISEIKDITHIAMGATAPSDVIQKIADIRIKHKNRYADLQKTYLKAGKSYNYASINALTDLYGVVYSNNADIAPILQEPNNILCIEYILAIAECAANIQPLIIERAGAAHNSKMFGGDFVSATTIRNAFDGGRGDEAARYIPFLFDKINEKRQNAPNIDSYKAIALYALKCESAQTLPLLRDYTDGLEHLLAKIDAPASYDQLAEHTALKTFGRKKIERLLLSCALRIKKDYLAYPFVTRLLACKKDFDFNLLPSFVLSNNSQIKTAASSDSQIGEALGVDERAAALYGTICGNGYGYYNYSLVKV